MHYDVIVIGAGQAGTGLAAAFAADGERAALIEADKPGGTCLNYGCRPTKALRASARVAHMARRAAEYGVQTGEVRVDFAAVMARKDEITGGMQDGLQQYVDGLEGVDFYNAYGRFEGRENGRYQVRAGDDLLTADRVYINTGARPAVPPISGLQDLPYMTNNELLALRELPKHLVIIGGGYIGLEFGQLFRRFGSEVTIIEGGPQVAGQEDEDVAAAVVEILEDEGVQILTGRAVRSVAGMAGELRVTLEDGRVVQGSHLLIATGRKPNSDKLNLGSIGLETDKRGYIPVNERLETVLPHIWALGDINGRGAFTHTAYQDYEIVLANHNGGRRSADERIMAYGVFIDPPLGRVGMTEKAARESGRRVLKSVWQMSRVSRARLDSETQGLIKVLVDADTEEFLGAAVLGMQGDDIIQIISNFMYTGASYKVMRDALPVHPTVAEFFPTILRNLKPLDPAD